MPGRRVARKASSPGVLRERTAFPGAESWPRRGLPPGRYRAALAARRRDGALAGSDSRVPPRREAVVSHHRRRTRPYLLQQGVARFAGRLESSFQGEPAAGFPPKRCSHFALREEGCLGWDDNPAAAKAARRVEQVRWEWRGVEYDRKVARPRGATMIDRRGGKAGQARLREAC